MTNRGRSLVLIAPTLLVIGIFMVLPLCIAVFYSFLTAGTYGGVTQPLTLDAYVQLLFQRDFDDTLVFSSSYIWIVARSIWIALVTTAGLPRPRPASRLVHCLSSAGAAAHPAVPRHAAVLDQHSDPDLLLDPDPSR